MAPFNFSDNVTLEDERVILRPLMLADDEYLIPFAQTEPGLWKYSTVPPVGPGGMREYIRAAVDARNAGKEYPFIVFDKQLQQYAGSTRFYDIQLSNKMLQLGYTWYGKDFQGTGLNKHCKYLLLQYDQGRASRHGSRSGSSAPTGRTSAACSRPDISRSSEAGPRSPRESCAGSRAGPRSPRAPSRR